MPDHPRIRGEHPGPWPASHHTGGIIPAYAGSTSVYETIHTTPPDHPRIRGEHRMRPVWYSSIPGSSPHTRGAQTPNRRTPSRLGIIPAYAGSTSSPASPTPSAPDHPRIRGEHDCSIYFTNFPTGSSPHTRGARVRLVGDHALFWIIPAYAGSTSLWSARSSRAPDHPRIRGEHDIRFATLAGNYGSSPHTRGAPRH